MVLVLGHLSPMDEIFAKSYVPPAHEKRKEEPKVLLGNKGKLKDLP
jgi:hypothetical protein